MLGTKWLSVVSLCIAVCSPARAQVCLDDTDNPGTSSREVTMRPLPKMPSFYSRADDYVAFISQRDVAEYFERVQRKSRDQGMRTLADLILSDLPIKANQDLFAYVTRDWSLWGSVTYSIIQLISEGKATVTNMSGKPVDRLTILREQSQQVRGTAALLGAKPIARILWKYECRTD